MATIRRNKSEPFAIVQKDPGPWPQVLINWLATLAVIIVFGLIMLFSASYTTGYLRMGDSFYYIKSQVFCLGQGGSMLLANDICARFSSLSNKFRTAGDSHLQILAASLMGPEDVVLFISYSGATRDMLETLRTAKASGAKIILLTHYEDSPGAAMADVVLRCGAQESPLDSGSIPIKVAVLYVGEVLLLRYMLDDPEHTNEAQDRTSEAVAIKLI